MDPLREWKAAHPLMQADPGAWEVLDAPQGATAVLNAANEIAVAAFLAGNIRFDQIHGVNVKTLDKVQFQTPATLPDLLAIDEESRATAQAISDDFRL